MEKINEVATVIAYDGMQELPETEINVGITNEDVHDPENEAFRVSYWSPRLGREVSMWCDEYPTNGEIYDLVKKSERCEFVHFA